MYVLEVLYVALDITGLEFVMNSSSKKWARMVSMVGTIMSEKLMLGSTTNAGIPSIQPTHWIW